VRKQEGNRPLGRYRRRCVNNIKMDIRKEKWVRIDWSNLTQDRDHWRDLVNSRINI
jgi:hypothetical protein